MLLIFFFFLSKFRWRTDQSIMEESKYFPLLSICWVYPKVVVLELKKKKRHSAGLIKYFILAFTSTGS